MALQLHVPALSARTAVLHALPRRSLLRPTAARFSGAAGASQLRGLASAGASAAVALAVRRSRAQRLALHGPLVRAAAGTAQAPASILFRPAVAPAVETGSLALEEWAGGALVLCLRAAAGEGGSVELGRLGAAVDAKLSGAISEFVAEAEFDAKEGAAKSFQVFGAGIKRVVLVGVGSKSGDEIDWRLVGAAAAGELKAMKGGSAAFGCIDGVQVQPLIEGVLLGLHADNRFRGSKTPEKEKAAKGPASIDLLGAFPPGVSTAVERARAVASGMIFARELVNGAPNIVNPPNLAAAAVDMAERLGLKAKILDEAACEELGMGSFLAVGRASNLPSSLIHLTYTPPDASDNVRKVGIVGKGLTFDSGGYNIKAGAGSMIELMKFDMGGAGTTLGTAAAIAQLKPTGVEVHFVIATCENMISGNDGALRPGDIITAMDGTTIEVNNTDAEGRLTLADALLYCQDQGATEVVDIATLTGAIMVGLGKNITGMWSNSDEFAGRIESSSKCAKEKLWRMPLEDTYWEEMKSEFADMVNTGSRFGGAITAALFLQKFVRKETTWAHLDIAGTAWADKAKGINAHGGTGSMVRTLINLIEGKKA